MSGPTKVKPLLLPLLWRQWIEQEIAKGPAHLPCVYSLLLEVLPEGLFRDYRHHPEFLAIGCDPLVEGLEADCRIYVGTHGH